ncbi:MAG: hypothetical protein D6811_12615 [Alphaproteobacteria bacterium]|nr:MAG: hypothetical protein D6811_12615 [Alphaproteobacteria bacterium]
MLEAHGVWWPAMVRCMAPTCLCVALMACASPSPSLWMARGGAYLGRVEVDAARFAVWRKDDVAEAHRAGFDGRLARYPMVLRGAVAIRALTGCEIRPGSLEGDQAFVRARLDCSGEGQAPPRPPPPPPAAIVCVLPPEPAVADSHAPEVFLTDCFVE